MFRDIPIPEPAGNEVLVKIKRIGVCGSDIHVFHGTHPFTSYPVVQGHEVSGEIVALGEKATPFQKGDRVTIQPQVVCGKCFSCTHGTYHICDELKVMGFQTTGAASEYFSVGADKVIKLSDNMEFDHGALVEPVAVAVHALQRHGDVSGKSILILGAGPIGNLTAQVALGMGAVKVMITDVSAYRLGVARECGIQYAVNPDSSDLEVEVRHFFGEHKADLIFDCAGINATIDQAIQNARKGTDIIVVGVFGNKPKVDLGLVQDRELRLIGTLMYQEKDYYRAIELIDKDIITLSPLISRHFDFDDYLKAYEFINDEKDNTMKIIIKV